MTVEDGEYRSVDGPWAVARESFQGHACVARLGGYHSTIHSKNLIAGESDKQSRSPQLPYDVGLVLRFAEAVDLFGCQRLALRS
jgi:hypothetical protein